MTDPRDEDEAEAGGEHLEPDLGDLPDVEGDPIEEAEGAMLPGDDEDPGMPEPDDPFAVSS